jgi:hypothetical protein
LYFICNFFKNTTFNFANPTMKQIYILLIFTYSLFFYSCELINPDEDIPVFFEVNSVSKISRGIEEGSASHNITDVWVYVNDEFLGVYEIPARFPVLKKGKANIQFFAGIKNSGLASARFSYPFYTSYKVPESTVLQEGNTYSFKPEFYYNTSTVFKWRENFEDINISIVQTPSSKASIKRIVNTPEVLEGNGSALIELNETENFFNGITSQEFKLPKSGASVYLEMDYYTTAELEVGVTSVMVDQARFSDLVLTINPTKKADGTYRWNKIYIDLTGIISGNIDAVGYYLTFSSRLSSGTSAKILLDNIKLVHF